MIWDLKITKIRPFGFLVGKTMKLSDEEADRYENITKFENKIADASKKNVKIDKEIAELESRLKTGDYGRSWGFKKSREDIEKMLFKKAISDLTEREKKILSLRFMAGKTQVEVAKEIGISQAQVSRLEKNALNSIKSQVN